MGQNNKQKVESPAAGPHAATDEESPAKAFAQIRDQMPRRKPQDVTVTVLGAGVAGLTAAHELMCRGFNVRVVERNIGPRPTSASTHPTGYMPHNNDNEVNKNNGVDKDDEVDVGGMARSQWGTVPAPRSERPAASAPAASARPLWGLGEYQLLGSDGKFNYGEGEGLLPVKFDAGGNIVTSRSDIKQWVKNHKVIQIVALSYEYRPKELDVKRTGGLERAIERVTTLMKQLAGVKNKQWMPRTVVTVPLDRDEYAGAIAGLSGNSKESTFEFPGVLLRAHDEYCDGKGVLPGEHGFRFFPGFYWHLRDTMARTPIYDFSEPGRPKRTHRTVHDNLQEVQWQVIADPTRAMPTAFRRVKPSSVEEFLEQWQTLRNDLGFRDTDMLRFILRLGRFATSSRRRRRTQYEHMSWWDFISLKRLDELPLEPRTAGRSGFGPRRGKDRPGAGTRAPESTGGPYADEDDFTKDARKAWNVALGKEEEDERCYDKEARKQRKDAFGKPKEDEPFTYERLHEAFEKVLEATRREDEDGDELKLGATNRLSYGLRFRRLLRHSPRALVAMDAPVTDAYTQGLLSIQLAMDQLGLNPRTDSTLNGPTSDAWFRHWKQYLKHEGVDFIAGEVTSINVETGRCEYVAVKSGELVTIEEKDEDERINYVICTMDPTAVARVLCDEEGKGPSEFQKQQELFSKCWGELKVEAKRKAGDPIFTALGRRFSDDADKVWGATMRADEHAKEFVTKYREWVHEGGRDPQRLDPKGAPMDARFQVLAGVQLYFDRPTAFELGHIYFPESPWGLMAMSQLQHWQGWRARDTGIHGNLSVVWGSWRKEEQGLGELAIRRLIVAAQQEYPLRLVKEVPEMVRMPWPSPGSLSRYDLAAYTRRQVAWCRGTDAQFRENLHVPKANYYHVDDYLQFRGDKAKWNRSPYLINVTGDWDNRPPGEPWNPNRRATRRGKLAREEGYRVYGDTVPLVFAGTHARTFTRMSTMEASNESARHAVNSVLHHLSMREEMSQFCEIAEVILNLHNTQCVTDIVKNMVTSLGLQEFARGIGGLERLRSDYGRSSPRQSDGPVLETTWFGDFCEIRDPEDYEIPTLDFFRKVDEELFAAQAPPARGEGDDEVPLQDPYPIDGVRVRKKNDRRRVPHLFDLLKLDAIPDRIEDGEVSFEQVIRILHGLSGALVRSLRGPEPLKAVLNLVDTLDGYFPPKG